jgi:hypothetical protein
MIDAELHGCAPLIGDDFRQAEFLFFKGSKRSGTIGIGAGL